MNDSLFILLIFFLMAMIGEGLLPGIVSSHVGMFKILFLVLLNMLLIYLLSIRLDIKQEANDLLDKKTAIFLLVILGALLFNSLFKVNIILAIAVLVLIAGIFYFLYKVIFFRE